MTESLPQLTREQLRAIQELAPVELARRGELQPVHFAIYASNRTWMPARHLDLLNEHLMKLEAGKIKRLLVEMPPGHGKALELDTPIPTPDGWARMGDLAVGDTVFGADGRPCFVTAVSPIWRNRTVYKVATDDGAHLVADANHLWRVRTCAKRPGVFKLHTTKTVAKKRAKRLMVERQGALRCLPAELAVPPYTLGAWLGDGHTDQATITAPGEDGRHILGRIRSEYVEVRGRKGTGSGKSFGLIGIRKHLRAIGVLGHKHIPMNYLRGSIDQRKALLQGLIDTDGHVTPGGQIQFGNTNWQLAAGVRELVLSLGCKASIYVGRATLYGKDCGPTYTVSFYMGGAASIPRKAARCREGGTTL